MGDFGKRGSALGKEVLFGILGPLPVHQTQKKTSKKKTAFPLIFV